MFQLKLESWSAVAPGMDDVEVWRDWLSKEDKAVVSEDALKLKEIPPLLRRRFSQLGKYAAKVTFNIQSEDQNLPIIFASRHGDTPLTLSLLEDIGRHNPMSPANFSLAVHNAVAGLLSIIRHDTSPMTAISSAENLILSTLHEAIAQLQSYEKVLCVIYDVPLPDIYTHYAESLPFPIAIAFVLGRKEIDGETLSLIPKQDHQPIEPVSNYQSTLDFVSFLAGLKQQQNLTAHSQDWLLRKIA